MKKPILISVGLLMGSLVFGQAVRDRNVIPVAVNLNQVLRMTISNGGNIEFVFNSIDDYKTGLSGDAATSGSNNPAASEGFYQSNFSIASSSRWILNYGSEQATFIGTDNTTNTLALDNVGFTLTETGAHNFEATGNAKGTTGTTELFSSNTDNGNSVTALQAFPIALLEDNDSATQANAGDETDNVFQITWRCGTAEAANGNLTAVNMNAQNIIDQQPSPNPDRYVTSVLFELAVDN